MMPFFLSCLYCKKEVKNVKEGIEYNQKGGDKWRENESLCRLNFTKGRQ